MNARGQAAVEMALGSLVFITILMVGIFFAELGFLAQKVQEAANFAVWDATGRRMHDIEANRWDVYKSVPLNGAVPAAKRLAEARYQDFDGRASRDRGGDTFLALSQASPIELTCADDTRRFGVAGLGPERASLSLERAMRGADGASGIACSAQSSIQSIRIPESFMENGEGQFRRAHWRAIPIPLCALGRANGGGCGGRLAVLLDDWALQTSNDSKECSLNIDSSAARCGNVNGNQSYYNWTNRVFTEFGATGGDGQALVGQLGGVAPYEGQFFMSFRGIESEYEQNIGTMHAGQTVWETTPFRNPNGVQHTQRSQNLWLGR